MNTREIIGYFLAAIGLIVLGIVIGRLELWSAVCCWTVPWFCSALALALLVGLSISVVSGQRLGEIEWTWAGSILLLMVLAGSAGIAVDNYYMERQCASGMCYLDECIGRMGEGDGPGRYVQNLVEWLSFCAIFGIVLVVSRLKKPKQKEDQVK